jgi:hypothetical protein
MMIAWVLERKGSLLAWHGLWSEVVPGRGEFGGLLPPFLMAAGEGSATGVADENVIAGGMNLCVICGRGQSCHGWRR